MKSSKAPQLSHSTAKMPTGEMEAGGVTYNYRGQAGQKDLGTTKVKAPETATNKLAC